METVKVIDQKLIAEIADKYSDPSKLTLCIKFESTIMTYNVLSTNNRYHLLRQIGNEIEDLIRNEYSKTEREVEAYEKELGKLHPSWSNADIRAKAVRMVHLGESLDVPSTAVEAWDGDDTHHINHGC